eukprot:2545276-Rhodomonas_salina.1
MAGVTGPCAQTQPTRYSYSRARKRHTRKRVVHRKPSETKLLTTKRNKKTKKITGKRNAETRGAAVP